MIDIIVVRGAGDIDGGEVVDPLLTSLEPALDRGRQEIEKSASAVRVSLRSVFRQGVRKGQLVEVADSLQGSVWRGVIMGVSHAIEGAYVYSTLDIERPL